MRNLLRCRRGSAAFATIIALMPLIGVVALGAEAGSWYVTKQHAQNAADAAAYSGGLKLACDNFAPCADTQTVAYRGKEFAAQNAFCNAGDYLLSRQPVCDQPSDRNFADRADQYAHGIGHGHLSHIAAYFVQAIVSQQQPTYLAKLLGLSTVNIRRASHCSS